MSGWNFKERDVAVWLRDLAHLSGLTTDLNGLDSMIMIGIAQEDIPKVDELGVGGEPVISYGDFVLSEFTLDTNVIDEEDLFRLEAYNYSGVDIKTGDRCVLLGFRSQWIVIKSDGGSGVFQIVASSEITAASGLTVGSGTGTIHELNAGGTAYVDTTNTADVRNPWEESIASGSMMTCHKEGDYYVVIQASCPSA